MSDCIPTQWISQYLIKVAETSGKAFADVAIEAITPSKKMRVQIIEFLTYNEDSAIWGRVSDKQSVIPVYFTKDAVSQYMKDLQGRRLTEAKHAIFCIGQLRPIFVRIPIGNNRSKLSEEFHIALEAGVVKFIGSGCGVYGSPQDVETNIQVRAWIRGLRRGGDGGDVLKHAKENAVHIEQLDAADADSPRPEIHSVTNHFEAPPRPQAQELERNSPHVALEHPVRSPDPMREYRKRWMHFEQDLWKYVMKPGGDDAEAQTLVSEQPQMGKVPVQESVPPDDVIVVTRSQPCTPPPARQTTPEVSEWPSSVPGSPAGVLPCVQPSAHTGDDELPNDCATVEASAEQNSSLHEPSTPPTTSPLRPPTPAQRARRSTLPPSTPDSSFIPAPPSSFSVLIRRNIKRKVPHPGVPPSPTHSSGPTRILVPNSDTSQSQSQSQPMSSQLLSELFSQSQPHQPPFPSQLTQEFKPGPTSTPAINQGVSGKGSAASRMLPGDQHETHWGGDRSSSPRFTSLDDREVLDDDDDQPSCTRDARQVLEAAAAEDLRVDAADAADVAVLLSEAPEEPSNEPEPTRATSPSPSPSMHSLFSGSPSFATSQSEVIPHIKSRATSPHLVEPVASTSRVPTHDVEAWKAPSFMTASKGEGKAAEQRSRPYETHKRRRTSPTPSSPLASHKRQKISADGMTEPALARPADDDERLPSTVSNGKRNHAVKSVIRESHRESPRVGQSISSTISNDISQIKDASLSQTNGKKCKRRLLGFEIDFDHIPTPTESPNPLLSMGKMRTILLRTGRVRTLGDEVTKDGSIFVRSD
ncbi:uncharacterized protein EDB91DRAFT_1251888 [Suillus paluster]|uniref:uncharacterized protein n=1 Tax=Suillus paluster TaxID=48578 RepID=UPI001B864CA9|nr:uncharacterized protein EDB91DRAFT_1251888 [Suillus paluster]KAG1732255.1 hypothetical protein EDB91DRAFT_1251888 [Suillus paluster]